MASGRRWFDAKQAAAFLGDGALLTFGIAGAIAGGGSIRRTVGACVIGGMLVLWSLASIGDKKREDVI